KPREAWVAGAEVRREEKVAAIFGVAQVNRQFFEQCARLAEHPKRAKGKHAQHVEVPRHARSFAQHRDGFLAARPREAEFSGEVRGHSARPDGDADGVWIAELARDLVTAIDEPHPRP